MTYISPKDTDDCTPLFLAAQQGNLDIVNLHLEKSDDANPKLNDGQSALHQAASNGHLAICEAIVKRIK